MKKRILALVLALALVFALASPALAAPATPIVFLAGFGTELYLNEGTPEQEGVLMGALGAEKIFAALGATLLDIFLRPLDVLFSPNHTADFLSAFVMHWLGKLACDENGDSLHPVSNDASNGEGRVYQGRPFYEFHFDWRLDPMETARALDAFIQDVKRETGSRKVHINALSFGSVIVCAYLELFKEKDDLESVFFCVSAHGGLTLGEDLIQKKLGISGEGLAAFLQQMVPDETGLLSPAFRDMEFTGMPLTQFLLNCFLGYIDDRLYEQAVIPLLGQMPAAWAFVADDEVFENGKRLLLADTAKYAGLIERLDDYHYRVGNRTNEILRDAAKKIKVALVCGYDSAPIPLGGTFLYQSDFLIDTARESGGAICAPYGGTLPAGYAQAVADGHGHISADRVIDASPCALPEQTWFVKGYQHQYEYSGAGLYPWFLAFEGQPTVWSDPAYPQFR